MTNRRSETKGRTGKRQASRPAPRGEKRPPLTSHTSLADFRAHYWYLTELVVFCRQHGLTTSGQKHDLIARIEEFLTTGRAFERSRAQPCPTRAKRVGPITVDTPVGDDYKCDAETRAFFRSIIGEHFHFTAHLQQYRRDCRSRGMRLTYGDLVREWLAEHERRKDVRYKSQIAPTWQYNQFVRDFMADKPRNSGKGIAEAARAWNVVRRHRGPHTYTEYLRLSRHSRRSQP